MGPPGTRSIRRAGRATRRGRIARPNRSAADRRDYAWRHQWRSLGGAASGRIPKATGTVYVRLHRSGADEPNGAAARPNADYEAVHGGGARTGGTGGADARRFAAACTPGARGRHVSHGRLTAAQAHRKSLKFSSPYAKRGLG